MFCKAYNIFIKTAILILLVFGLWLVIGGAYKKDIGNLSDWIIAACNILMALVAVLAFFKAKYWFSDKKKENAAVKFEELLLSINSLRSHLDAFYDHLDYDKIPSEAKKQYSEDQRNIIEKFHRYKSSRNLLCLWSGDLLNKQLKILIESLEEKSYSIFDALNKSSGYNYSTLDKDELHKVINEIRGYSDDIIEFTIDNVLIPDYRLPSKNS